MNPTIPFARRWPIEFTTIPFEIVGRLESNQCTTYERESAFLCLGCLQYHLPVVLHVGGGVLGCQFRKFDLGNRASGNRKKRYLWARTI